ncbi:mechanosensitive ion channel domain-containing protein [Flammeovirga sp. EKP202]|uniref:mechanosensitive ion channel domain-containing protein n=1 Tax=Flammeovirga sp. EKP202 TaxID=2770592 RepID=UPI00165F8884|nr:mechanosensitive ion channel domain-containing protein [Flammeovirga sp. EKP202]MBD0399954.1 mechanosensitive ion channel [Flammeovirga sp. EKP202]
MNQYFHNINLDIGNILSTVLIISIALALKLSFLRLLNKTTIRSTFHARRKVLISKVINVAVIAVSILLVLGVWEVNPEDLGIYLTSIFTIIGVAFFAQWSHLSNITACVIIFLTSPMKIGDKITIYEGDGINGEITDIGLFFTTIITEDNQRLMLTNTFFMQKMWSVKLSTIK